MPDRENVLCWHSRPTSTTQSPPSLHLHLDNTLAPRGLIFPRPLAVADPYVITSMRVLGAALSQAAPAPHTGSLATALVAYLVHHLASQTNVLSLDPQGLGAEEVRIVIAFMQDHLAEHVSLEQLAALVGLSKYHFLRRFSRSVGETPARYLARLRMDWAASLLRSSTLSIAQIAATWGYRSPSKFSTAFSREYHCSPMVFRRRVQH